MAIKSSGSLSMVTDIVGEFGGTAPHGLKEYYRNGSAGVSSQNTNIPTSGEIGFKDFYGAVLQFSHTISGTHLQMNLNTYLVGQGWNGADPVVLTIPSSTWLYSNSTSVAGLTIPSNLSGKLTIHHYGKIIGMGGQGGDAGQNDAGAGGPAVSNSASGVVLHTYSGSFIAGGGGGGGSFLYGGGGGGAGGGRGGNSNSRHTTLSGGAGNTSAPVDNPVGYQGYGNGGASWGSPYVDYNYCGSDGGSGNPSAPQGGTAGGGGATAIDTGSSCGFYGGAGSGGGRRLPGTGAAGGNRSGPYRSSSTEGGTGGSAGNVGRNGIGSYGQEDGAGGGGGWGAAGGTAVGSTARGGGAGGAAWAGTNWASRPTASGTIYGST